MELAWRRGRARVDLGLDDYLRLVLHKSCWYTSIYPAARRLPDRQPGHGAARSAHPLRVPARAPRSRSATTCSTSPAIPARTARSRSRPPRGQAHAAAGPPPGRRVRRRARVAPPFLARAARGAHRRRRRRRCSSSCTSTAASRPRRRGPTGSRSVPAPRSAPRSPARRARSTPASSSRSSTSSSNASRDACSTGCSNRCREPERRRVLCSAARRRFARDEVLFWAGDPGDSLPPRRVRSRGRADHDAARRRRHGSDPRTRRALRRATRSSRPAREARRSAPSTRWRRWSCTTTTSTSCCRARRSRTRS